MGAQQAVDNDVLLKAIRYGLETAFWPTQKIGVLGAARFVIGKRVESEGSGRPERLKKLLGRAEELEPDPGELDLAAEIERRAAELGVELDSGESQLAAVVVRRGIDLFETGDKRAIAGLEPLMTEIEELDQLCGRVRCLEQIAHRVSADAGRFTSISHAICAEQGVDKSLSTCFSCYTGGGAERSAVLDALRSYIEDLRSHAPSVLEAGP
jgi:hypothetical protein